MKARMHLPTDRALRWCLVLSVALGLSVFALVQGFRAPAVVSYDVNLAPDGTFSGFVPVQEGRNLLQVTVLASDGGEGSVSLDLDFEKSGLTGPEMLRELEETRQRNRLLMLQLERKRIEKFRERQQKNVIIEAE